MARPVEDAAGAVAVGVGVQSGSGVIVFGAYTSVNGVEDNRFYMVGLDAAAGVATGEAAEIYAFQGDDGGRLDGSEQSLARGPDGWAFAWADPDSIGWLAWYDDDGTYEQFEPGPVFGPPVVVAHDDELVVLGITDEGDSIKRWGVTFEEWQNAGWRTGVVPSVKTSSGGTARRGSGTGRRRTTPRLPSTVTNCPSTIRWAATPSPRPRGTMLHARTGPMGQPRRTGARQAT